MRFFFTITVMFFLMCTQAYSATMTKHSSKSITDAASASAYIKDMFKNSTMSAINNWYRTQPNWYYNNYYTMDSAKAYMKRVDELIDEEAVFEKAYPCMVKNGKSVGGRRNTSISDCIIPILEQKLEKNEEELNKILVKDTEREKAAKSKKNKNTDVKKSKKNTKNKKSDTKKNKKKGKKNKKKEK